MEYRKIIKFGNSSHILSIPNEWLKKNKLKKGDLIYISENGNNELVLSPQLKDENHESEITIHDNKDIEELHRKIVSSYIAGYNVLNIKLKNSENIEVIKNFLDSLMAFEIMEQSPDEIKAKDLLNIKEISIEKIMRRIDTIIRSMMEDAKLSHKINNYETIYKRDFDINKLTFLSYRTIKKCLEYPKIAEFVGIKYNKLIEEWLLVFYLEKIADEVKRISRYLTRIKNNSERIKEVIMVYSEVKDDFSKCMNAYYKKDIAAAHEILDKKENMIKKCNDILDKNNNPYIFNIIDRTKALEKYIRDITILIYQEKV